MLVFLIKLREVKFDECFLQLMRYLNFYHLGEQAVHYDLQFDQGHPKVLSRNFKNLKA